MRSSRRRGRCRSSRSRCRGTARRGGRGFIEAVRESGNQEVRGMKAVVVGGSGQIGGWLLRALGERGHEAVGTFATVAYPGLVHLDAADLKGSADWLRGQRPEVVFYPAGFT